MKLNFEFNNKNIISTILVAFGHFLKTSNKNQYKGFIFVSSYILNSPTFERDIREEKRLKFKE